MAVDPKFKELGSFEADRPLERQLLQLEASAAQAFGNVATQGRAKLKPTRRQTADYVAKLGELVVASGELSVTFPTATSANAGEPIGIEVDDATVTVRSVGCLVQGEANELLSTKGLYVYESDSVGWWRQPAVTSVTVGPGLTGGGTGDIDIGIDGDVVVTTATLSAAVQPVRSLVEEIRVLLIQLVKLELGDDLDRGVEGINV